MKQLVIHNITSKEEWRNIFHHVIPYCNQFTITFPNGDYDDENPLLGGKNQLLLLRDVEIKESTKLVDGKAWSLSAFCINLLK